MVFRNCAGGVVFFEEKVLLLKNEKDEWILPKGVIRNGDLSRDVALRRVKEETGVDAEIISSVGETCYEFFSIKRQKDVCNQVGWYLMRAESDTCKLNAEMDFQEVGFYPIEEALEKITHPQERSLVRLSYQKYKSLETMKMLV